MLFRSIPFRGVVAKQGKRLRAEPVSALYEQGRVSHVGAFDELETQMTSWEPDSGYSPDRLDALVHGLTELGLNVGASADRFLQQLAPACEQCGQPTDPSKACTSCGASPLPDYTSIYPR